MLRTCTILALAMTGLQTSLGKADAPPAIIPQPAELDATPGEFRITESTTIWVAAGDAEVRACGTFLAECLRQQTGYELPVQEAAAGKLAESASGGLRFIATRSGNASDEEYHLLVTPNAVTLTANQPRGVFLGIQTIRQLLRPAPAAGEAAGIRKNINWRLPCVRISDRPRYRWRGMLLDCGRHFMTKDFVKRYIDLLAYHKMNVLHWHLTEDQGWRIEIRKYPKLTEIGAWRGTGGERYGGFYTQDDIREIVAYAQSRYVTIVPEIEMPGHAQAALASYPKLSCTGGPFEVGTKWGVYEEVYCAGNEQTFAFLEDVLSEVLELFPSEFIHIGGDECPKTRWQACPKCQARIKAEGLKDEHELQSYFIRRIEKFLNSKGRRLIGWDEILEGGLAPNATVQSWRGLAGAIAAAESGHDVVSSPTSHCYLDYAQARRPGEPTWMGYIDLATTYSFEPTPAQLTPAQARHVLGLEGNIWTEHAPQERVDWQVFRGCAPWPRWPGHPRRRVTGPVSRAGWRFTITGWTHWA